MFSAASNNRPLDAISEERTRLGLAAAQCGESHRAVRRQVAACCLARRPDLAARLDESVLEQIIAETGGNPLALIELPRGLSPAQLAGGFGLPAALPLSTGIERSFTRRLARLPREARRLLLLAAAEPVGDPALLWRAARQLGIPETAAHALRRSDAVGRDPRREAGGRPTPHSRRGFVLGFRTMWAGPTPPTP